MIEPRISLLLPTLGRPALATSFFRSVVDHTENLNEVEVVLYLNEDDPESHDLDDKRLNISRIIGPPATMGSYNTCCLERSVGQIIVLVNDDLLIRTPGWDRTLLDLDAGFKDGIYLAYANDLFKKRRVSTFPILSRRTCNALVRPYPKEYRGALIDYHLFDIFKRLQKLGHDRIRYLRDVIFEHTHYRTGKVPYDTTYGKRGRFDDDDTFVALRILRGVSAQRLRAVVENERLGEIPEVDLTPSQPSSVLDAVLRYTRVFLSDAALPLDWRSFLFMWYCGRYLARKGYLGGPGRA